MKISPEDQVVLSKILNKDEKTLYQFYKSHYRQIFFFVHRQLKNYALSEEITQDIFFDFIEALRDFHGQCSLKTYLYSIAKNKIADEIRRKKIKKILFSALPYPVVESLKVIFFDEELEKKELARKIKKTLEKLPNDYRLVLRLKYIENETVKAIAKKLSLGFKATESLIFRARKAFIKIFNNLT